MWPTNHDSGAGQYSVTATPLSHLPLACLLGGAGMRVGVADTGARPPPKIDAPPELELGGGDEPITVPPPPAPRAGRAA